MTDDIRGKLEAAYRKLSILPDRQSRLGELIESIEPAADIEVSKPKRIRKKGAEKIREELETLSLRARDLISELDAMHHSTKIALVTHKFGGKETVERLVADLDKLSEVSQAAAKSELEQQMFDKPLKRSVLIAWLLHGHYQELTGSVPPQTRTTGGAFFALVTEVFDTLGVDGSVENAVREAYKLGS